jgi:hypothetical protein
MSAHILVIVLIPVYGAYCATLGAWLKGLKW